MYGKASASATIPALIRSTSPMSPLQKKSDIRVSHLTSVSRPVWIAGKPAGKNTAPDRSRFVHFHPVEIRSVSRVHGREEVNYSLGLVFAVDRLVRQESGRRYHRGRHAISCRSRLEHRPRRNSGNHVTHR